ncbi:hypothetical protein X777_16123 [Ooceraea biroi]|uniref:Uncharacterized protein n=1 Tax=Ooceraea biroi TaxID=2015173 RepID=A0A026WV44_OOCBI|nr:hypothetical protein X777_16123 [Ooceraea biroi]
MMDNNILIEKTGNFNAGRMHVLAESEPFAVRRSVHAQFIEAKLPRSGLRDE